MGHGPRAGGRRPGHHEAAVERAHPQPVAAGVVVGHEGIVGQHAHALPGGAVEVAAAVGAEEEPAAAQWQDVVGHDARLPEHGPQPSVPQPEDAAVGGQPERAPCGINVVQLHGGMQQGGCTGLQVKAVLNAVVLIDAPFVVENAGPLHGAGGMGELQHAAGKPAVLPVGQEIGAHRDPVAAVDAVLGGCPDSAVGGLAEREGALARESGPWADV